MCCLGAIIQVSLISLFDLKPFKRAYKVRGEGGREGRGDVVNIEVGLVIGIVVRLLTPLSPSLPPSLPPPFPLDLQARFCRHHDDLLVYCFGEYRGGPGHGHRCEYLRAAAGAERDPHLHSRPCRERRRAVFSQVRE